MKREYGLVYAIVNNDDIVSKCIDNVLINIRLLFCRLNTHL